MPVGMRQQTALKDYAIYISYNISNMVPIYLTMFHSKNIFLSNLEIT